MRIASAARVKMMYSRTRHMNSTY